MDKNANNWDSLFNQCSKKSFSPITHKGGWQFGNNLERLKEDLMQFQNISKENMCDQIKQEHKEIVDNFDRLRKSILQHKESNRNLWLPSENPNECNPEIEFQNKMYNVASMKSGNDGPQDSLNSLWVDKHVRK